MNIVTKRLAELVPYDYNPRRNSEAVEYVANSIKEFGFKVPIIIDKNNVIVAGHTRWLAGQSLGLEEVPCIVADDLTDDQIKAFRLADNKVSEIAGWDFDLLAEELSNIDMDMTDFGFEVGDWEAPAEPTPRDDSATPGAEEDDEITVTMKFRRPEDWEIIKGDLEILAGNVNAEMKVKNG